MLLLIQLKRAQAQLEKDCDFFREKLDQIRPTEREYKHRCAIFPSVKSPCDVIDYCVVAVRRRRTSSGRFEELELEHEEFVDLRRQVDEIENQVSCDVTTASCCVWSDVLVLWCFGYFSWRCTSLSSTWSIIW